MSRVGKQPIPIPDKVKIDVSPTAVSIEGPKGKLSTPIPNGIKCEKQDNVLVFTRRDDSGPQRAFHGLARALAANAVRGAGDKHGAIGHEVLRSIWD